MIQLSAIHKAFGARVLFDDVTWQVRAGERVAAGARLVRPLPPDPALLAGCQSSASETPSARWSEPGTWMVSTCSAESLDEKQ